MSEINEALNVLSSVGRRIRLLLNTPKLFGEDRDFSQEVKLKSLIERVKQLLATKLRKSKLI